MNFSTKTLLFIFFGIALAACSQDKKDRAGLDPAIQKQAPADIQQSFDIKKTYATLAAATSRQEDRREDNHENNQGFSVDKAHVLIQKSALEKEFLLSVNLLAQAPTPQFSSLQSRVISFILRDKKVYMLDVTKNNIVGEKENIPQTLLIAEFQVLSESDTALEIDFNAGMRQVFTTSDIRASDIAALNANNYRLSAAQVRVSYLAEVSIQNSKALFIKQVAQIDAEDGGAARAVEIRYQIKAYLPDPSFIPVVSKGFDKVGYFEASPLLLRDGSSLVYAMKWNEKKTIQFAVSANTPMKYRALVKSALLYWNKILGEKAIEVTQLEDKSITAPNFDLNIIQWVDWDTADGAFADAHIDPRTGEVTSAQIFFTSAFMLADKAGHVRTEEASHTVLKLKGFTSARLCERNLNEDFKNKEAASADITPAAMDKAVRDYAYEVIAHELGHVLGLRHNFAGSLAANYDFKDRKNLVMSYYKNQKAPEGIVSSSSVMEYSRFEESAWNGDRLQNGGAALAYDDMAIRHLYFAMPLPAENRPAFCTDSSFKTYADCVRHDAGRSAVSAAAGAYRAKLNSLAAQVLNIYISSSKLADESGVDLIPVSEVSLPAKSTADVISEELTKLISLMKNGASFIKVQTHHLPALSPMGPAIKKLEKEYVQSEFTRLGGLESLTQTIPENYDAELLLKFSHLLENPKYNSGLLPRGGSYSFSEEEKQAMKKQVALFAAQTKEQLILNELRALSGEAAATIFSDWADSDLTLELAKISLKRLVHYGLTKTNEKIKTKIGLKDGTKKQVELPVYKYPLNIRLAAASLFAGKGAAIDWGFSEKLTASELLKKELLPLGDSEKLDMSSLNRETLQWVLSNTQLMEKLGN